MFSKNAITRAITPPSARTTSYDEVLEQVQAGAMMRAIVPDLDPSFVKEAAQTFKAQGGARMPSRKAIERYQQRNKDLHDPA